jgi:hypothetical protein
MLYEACELLGILKAPLAHVQALHLAADKLLWVERGIPWLDQQRTKHDFEDIGRRRRLVVRIGGRA